MEKYTQTQYGAKVWENTTRLEPYDFNETPSLTFILFACSLTVVCSAIAPVETLIALLIVWALFS